MPISILTYPCQNQLKTPNFQLSRDFTVDKGYERSVAAQSVFNILSFIHYNISTENVFFSLELTILYMIRFCHNIINISILI